MCVCVCVCVQMAESKSGGEECPESPTTTEGSNTSDATDTEREWAQAAQTQFTKGNYVAALTLLSYLHGTRPKDPKVSLWQLTTSTI